MQQRISIITLAVQDLAAATDFYIHKFGWIKSEMSTEGISFFHCNGMLFGLYPIEEFKKGEDFEISEKGRSRFTLAYCARSEAEVDELFERFATNKVTILKSPEKVFWGGYSGYIEDLDGNLWEIAFNPFLKFDEAGNIKA